MLTQVEIAPPLPLHEKAYNLLFRRVSCEDLVMFTDQLATMLETGVQIKPALEGLRQEMPNRHLRGCLDDLIRDLERGVVLDEAMQRHPYAFSPFYRSMTQVGMDSGEMVGVLRRTETQLAQSEELRKGIVGALIYPALVALVAVGVFFIVVYKLVPTLRQNYETFGAELPPQTLALVWISHLLTGYWFLGPLAALALFGLAAYVTATPGGRLWLDRWWLRIPALGRFVHAAILARFTQALGICVASDVPMLRALVLSSGTVDNTFFQQELTACAELVEQGSSLALALSRTPLIPNTLIQMFAAGEQTGELAPLLSKVSRFYEWRATHAAKMFARVLEPVCVVVLGVGVALLLWAAMTPIFEMASRMS